MKVPLPFVAIASVVVLVACDASRIDLAQELQKQTPRFQIIVESLDNYYKRHGRYPQSLEELKLGALPTVVVPDGQSTLRPSGPTYHVARDRAFFRISYGLSDSRDSDSHAVASYFLPDRKWDFSGYVPHFSHLESQYYGGVFLRTGSTASLELTVRSLLDAVKNNGTVHPCRNFWGDWIEKSLGSAHVARHYDFQHSPGLEARLYSPKDQGPSYAFVFRDQLYPPMTKPLPIVSAVYTNRDAKTEEWLLLQSCDSSS